MKKAAVPTTTARGTAVSRSRITAVQSVYIAADENRCHHPSCLLFRARLPLLLLSLLIQAMPAAPALAGVEFDDCQPSGDGGITCDTRPTGNTRMDELDARYGLLDQASPGWREFDPVEGDEDMFGGNET
jgi:hypothetical protein